MILKECTIASADLSHSATRLDVLKRTHSFTSERDQVEVCPEMKDHDDIRVGRGELLI